MANERVFLNRNTGTKESPVWERWFAYTVADAVLMSEADGEVKTIKDYVNEQIATLIDGAPESADTLKELFDIISSNSGIIETLNAAISSKAEKTHTHTDATTSAAGFMSASDKTKLSGVATGANNYTHPSYASKTSGLYKITVDAKGHVSAGSEVAKADITSLGIPEQDTVYTHPSTHAATMITGDTTHRFVTDAEKATWNNKANVYFGSSLPTSAPVGSICFLTV